MFTMKNKVDHFIQHIYTYFYFSYLFSAVKLKYSNSDF